MVLFIQEYETAGGRMLLDMELFRLHAKAIMLGRTDSYHMEVLHELFKNTRSYRPEMAEIAQENRIEGFNVYHLPC